MTPTPDKRGAVNIVDIILGMALLVGIIVLAPVIYQFIGMATAEADPFTSLVLQLTVPTLFIGFIISMGVSARRGR